MATCSNLEKQHIKLIILLCILHTAECASEGINLVFRAFMVERWTETPACRILTRV